MPFNPNDHLMKLKGKDYLEVKWRMVWFREDWPCGTIDTEVVTLNDQQAVFRAVVCKVDEDGTVKGRATGTKSETPKGFSDYIEKAETGAVGRALAMLGYGTQFAPELEEGTERIVDSPVERRPAPQVDDAERRDKTNKALRAKVKHSQLHAWANKQGWESLNDAPLDMMVSLDRALRDADQLAAFNKKFPVVSNG